MGVAAGAHLVDLQTPLDGLLVVVSAMYEPLPQLWVICFQHSSLMSRSVEWVRMCE